MQDNTQIAPLDAPTCSSFFGDVPLKVAMIGWTPKGRFGKTPLTGIPGKIVIIPKTNDGRDWFRHLGVTDSTGACWSAWKTWTKEKRLLKLYIEAWHIIARDGVSPEDVHTAFMVIPEYRDSLSGETFFSWTNVKVMAHPLAGANVDRGVEVEIGWKHR